MTEPRDVQPAWKDDFPIDWVDDHFVTRREFTKSLVLVSFATFAATGSLVGMGLLERRRDGKGLPAKRIAAIGEIPVGGSKVFHYPEEDDPCLLIRLSAGEYAAYGQKCTHLGCPVTYRAPAKCLYCPCHEGFFNAADGTVRSGPPPRPLPKVVIERRGDELWATGMSR